MAVSLRKGLCISGSNGGVVLEEKKKKKLQGGSFSEISPWKNDFKGENLVLRDQTVSDLSIHAHTSSSAAAATVCIPQGLRWWEKNTKPNMVEINSATDLVNYLLNAGDKLVIVDFYSPGCGGCKALHPKICQFAESSPEKLFLKVNYEQHKAMCNALNVHVLPFFRFYRGAQGRLCSFSCTNATIKKFKDTLEKHGTDRCSLGQAKGLNQSELLSLASNRDINFHYPLNSAGTRGSDTIFPGSLAVGEMGEEMAMLSMQ